MWLYDLSVFTPTGLESYSQHQSAVYKLINSIKEESSSFDVQTKKWLSEPLIFACQVLPHHCWVKGYNRKEHSGVHGAMQFFLSQSTLQIILFHSQLYSSVSLYIKSQYTTVSSSLAKVQQNGCKSYNNLSQRALRFKLAGCLN